MSSKSSPVLTPVGRIVGGDCFVPQDKDADGNVKTFKTGADAGKPRTDYYIGLAVPKTDPGVMALLQLIHAKAREGFPNLFDAAGNCAYPQFAFKYKDGDSTVANKKGKRPCDNEGYPGHWVFAFSSTMAPKCYTKGGLASITDPAQLKRGYYVRISGSVVANDSTQNPGVYLNPYQIELRGIGEEISSGPDAATVFAAPASALPPGATEAPTVANAFAVPAPVAAPAIPAPAPVVAPATVIPAPDFLKPTPPPPAPTELKVSYNGAVYTEAQLKSSGWTDAQIATLPRA